MFYLRQVNIVTSPVEIAPITWDDFANIFAPFSWQVWMSFGGMLGLGAFLVPPPPSLPYKVDTSRPFLRTKWTCLVPLPQVMVIPLTLGMSGNFNPAEPKVHNPLPPLVLIGHAASHTPY